MRGDQSIWVWTQIGAETIRVGTLYVTAGGRRMAFRFEQSYLEDPRRYPLDPALPETTAATPLPFGGLCGTFSDSAPDSWGRGLIRRRNGGRADDVDALLGVDDRLRMGALQYTRPEDDMYLARSDDPVPPVIDLGHLQRLSERVEADPAFTELRELAQAGSSLGGARPKVTVRDTDGRLAIAKFSSRKDDLSVIAWEHAVHVMAADAGVDVPTSRLLRVGGRPVLLMDRFDRDYLADDTVVRIPYMSAMTRLISNDGSASSYAEIAETAETAADRTQLLLRAAFGLMVNNTDDHLRNHGFLYRGGMWRLSPAFDINPSRDGRAHATPVTPMEPDGFEALVRSAPLFDLEAAAAEKAVEQVTAVTARWRDYAHHSGIAGAEITAMAPAFDNETAQRARAEFGGAT